MHEGRLMKCTLAAINRLYSLFWNVGQFARPRFVILAAAITYFAAPGTNVALACALEAPIGFTAFSVEHKAPQYLYFLPKRAHGCD